MSPTPTTTTPQNYFFDDIVALILESDDHWWPRDLCRLARVSRAWLHLAQRRLYSHPSLYSFKACRQLSQTLQCTPCLRALVHGLELSPYPSKTTTSEDLSALRYLLSLPGLQKLSFGGELAYEAGRFFRLLSSSESVTELNVDGTLLADKLNFPASLEWDDFMAMRFPKLQTLRLSHLELDVLDASPPPFRLRKLVLDNVHVVGESIIPLLDSSTPLHLSIRMSADWDWAPDEIHSVLEHCTLESFRLEARGITSQWQGFFDENLPPCPSLQTLIIDDVYLDVDNLMSISEQCPRLQTLGIFGRVVRVSADQWTDLILSGALPRLLSLSLPSYTYQPPVVPWTDANASQIREACESRGVAITSGISSCLCPILLQ